MSDDPHIIKEMRRAIGILEGCVKVCFALLDRAPAGQTSELIGVRQATLKAIAATGRALQEAEAMNAEDPDGA